MGRFSKLFWFTITAGTLSAVLFDCAALRIYATRSDEIIALIRTGSDAADFQALPRLNYITAAAMIIGPPLLFWLAYKLAPKAMMLSTRAIKGAVQ